MAVGQPPARNASLLPPGLDAMSRSLAQNWWALAIRGVLAILFGLAAFVLPLTTLQALVFLFAVYIAADGVFAIVAGIRAASNDERWGALITEGVVNLVAGAVAFLLPGLTVVIFITLLSVWGIVSGAFAIFAALRLHRPYGRTWLWFAGVVSVIWGGALFVAPAVGAIVLTWWLGGYAMIFGVALLVLALRLRAQRMA